MSKVRSKSTKPELLIRKAFFAGGYRYRLNYAKLPGKPDLFIKKLNLAVFVHGCFWHGHRGCKSHRIPKSNVEFWLNKIERNQRRDAQVLKSLHEKGIRVLTIWECEVKQFVTDFPTALDAFLKRQGVIR